MTDLTKTAVSLKHDSGLGMSELIAMAAIVFLFLAVQGMFIGKNFVTLNSAAKLAPSGIIAP